MSPRLKNSVYVLLAVALVAACDREPAGPEQQPPEPSGPFTCSSAGGTAHTGSIADEVWLRSGSPHRLADTVRLTGVLTIEPGSLVCAGRNAGILIASFSGRLMAQGTPQLPIVFTASDPAVPWAGLYARPACTNVGGSCVVTPGRISNARIEHAENGVLAGAFIDIDSTHFRQIRCTAANVASLARSVVDSAGLTGCTAVVMSLGLGSTTTNVFEDNIVRASGGAGVSIETSGLSTSGRPSGRVSILGGRIEGSKGIGLYFSDKYGGEHIAQTRAVRIVGSGGHPMRGPIAALLRIWPTRGDQDSLLGNVSDTVVVFGATAGGELLVRRGLVLKIEPVLSPPWFDLADLNMRIEAGAAVVVNQMIRLRGGNLIAEGTAAAPIRITGYAPILIDCSGCADSRIAYATLDGVLLWAHDKLTLDHVRARGATIELSGNDSRITESVIEDAPGNGVLVTGNNVLISSCEIRRSRGEGIQVIGAVNLQIRDCAFELNAGSGVQNNSGGHVDARFNWWGDPAGPFGPAGDGVYGDVDFSFFRTTPFVVTTAR